MRIFNWVYKRFPQSPHHYACKDAFGDPWETPHGSPLSSKTALGGRAVGIPVGKGDDTEALLRSKAKKDDSATAFINNWDFQEVNELLAIGTLGDCEQAKANEESLDEETFHIHEAVGEEVIDPAEVEVFEEKLGEVFGSAAANKTNQETSPNLKLQEDSENDFSDGRRSSGIKVLYPLHEYFEVSPLAKHGSNTPVSTNEKRTTLADLFAKSKHQANATAKEFTKEVETEGHVGEGKKKAGHGYKKHLSRSGRSIISKIVSWREVSPVKAKKWVKKMLYKKIHPKENAGGTSSCGGDVVNGKGNEKGRIDISKTYINCSKLEKFRDQKQCSSAAAPNKSYGESEFTSLLETGGGQEYWIKTDSEYVVLEL
eukprot:TRINITY_DN2858_c0_g1_i1.p1 TRINITY_DN2858_c0_g1~~TRINITY_DN2858_c0_g1_i1.p1  ORF type:complete len:371 (-),score=85.46 TRINITY_DN2858_c0_g1_i1:113-1225(-)